MTTTLETLRARRQQHIERLGQLRAVSGRDFTTAELDEVDHLSEFLPQLDARIADLTDSERRASLAAAARVETGQVDGDGPRGSYRAGQTLGPTERMADYVRSRGLVRAGEDEGGRPLNMSLYVRGLVTGDWNGAEPERRAMVEGTATAGGHLVPTPLSAEIIDRARNTARVLQAGARTVPMETSTLKIARVTGDPTAAWHSELATIALSDLTLDAVTLTARTLASRVQLSRELLEDASEVDNAVSQAFSAQAALTLDLAALYGSGTAPEPRGLINTTGITVRSTGTNGATLTNYDPIVDGVFDVQDANFTPNAVVMSPRTARSLAKSKDTTNQPLRVPPALDGVQMLATSQVPNTRTQGTASNASDAFVGQWNQLLIGIRHQLEVQVLRERAADIGAVELLMWLRADVAVAQPKAFTVVTGLLP